MKMSKVFIGVGHGGKDSGAVANGLKEKDLNLDIALACNSELIRHGVSVLMSRETDVSESLANRIKECNAYKPDLAIDIHNNAGGGDGGEAFYHYKGGRGKVLADNVLCEIVNTGQNSRGAKIKKNSQGKDYYGFIRQTTCPAIIIECAFMDNTSDVKTVDTLSERIAIGKAIAKGILKTLNIEYIAEPISDTADQKTIYRVQVGAFKVWANAEKVKAELISKGYEAIIVEV